MKVIALIDGEHYPSVTRWGLASATAAGYEVVAALAVGGVEKLAADHSWDLGGVSVLPGEDEPRAALHAAIGSLGPEAVLDLSDEPVLSYERRMELIAVTLANGCSYIGPDFRFDPPIWGLPLPVPTIGVIGTGKRVAKTAVSAHVARIAAEAGERPAIVAMGRGGPPHPVAAGPDDVTVEALLARVDRGEHAASDFLEDALTSGVPTFGARRAGGGLAGRPFVTNVAEAAEQAVASGAGMVILEGSGSSIPILPWDSGVLVMRGSLPPEHLAGYLGPFRLLLSDLAVFIIEPGSKTEPANLSTLGSHIRRLRPELRVAHVELEPAPLADVKGNDVFFATTAKPEIAERLAERLEAVAGCRVVATSSNLADRRRLKEEMDSAPEFDALVTELKAAAVDVAARGALDRGARVVFMDNRPKSAGGDGEVDDLVREAVALARERAEARGSEGEGGK